MDHTYNTVYYMTYVRVDVVQVRYVYTTSIVPKQQP